MGNSKKNYLSIKSKLMAAVAMLLVASFMVVSSTYAWFTLSTAPEVTGIRTTIGANGSLEIALAYGDSENPFNKEDVTSGVGDSGDYTTWGNLVDASDEKYGMDKITLLPSRLYLPTTNVTKSDDGSLTVTEYLATSPLSTPVYGADGRVASLENSTVFGVYDGTQFVSDESASGLRAIGTASGMTKQQSVYRQAKQDVSTSLTAAQTKASASLNANGNALATVVAAYATGTATQYDITCVTSMVTMLEQANASIEAAIRNYFLAFMASKMGTYDEVAFNTAVTEFNKLTTAELIAGGKVVGGYTLPSLESVGNTAIGSVCAKWQQITTTLKNANLAIGGVGDVTQADDEDLKAVLIDSGLMKIDSVTINGLTKDEIKADGGLGELLNAYMADGIFKVQLPAGSGVYSDIAEVAGNYKAQVVIQKLAYGDIQAENVPAQMLTTVDTVINLKAAIPAAPESVGGGNSAITDFYGYAIDLVFRTNATNSNLMLQTTPEQRIYSDSTNQQTQGGGSKMTFAPGEGDFTTAQMKELMKAIRIVFTTKEAVGEGDTATYREKIVAIAGLDVDEATANADGGYDVSIKLFNYTWTVDDINNPTAVVLKIDEENRFMENDSDKDNVWAQTLISLNQNEATVLTAMVYLDGDYVGNEDVATKGTSMIGSLNLQFSSDAELVPMKNTPLFEGGDEVATTTASTTTAETTTAEETTAAAQG